MKQSNIIARFFMLIFMMEFLLACTSNNSNPLPVSNGTPNLKAVGNYSVSDGSTSAQPSTFTIPAIDANTYSFAVTTYDIDKTKNNPYRRSIVNTHNLPYQSSLPKAPDGTAKGNLWFNNGDGTLPTVPSWSAPEFNFNNINPQMNSLAENPYTITETSPANNAGVVVPTLPIPHDLAGVPRGGAGEISIGAYEYSGMAKAPPSATQLMIIDE